MKTIFVVAGALLISVLADAQNKGDETGTSKNMAGQERNGRHSNQITRPKTLFNGNIYSSGYGALSTQYSKFNHQDAMFLGAYGGWMINHKLMLGVGGYGLVTRHTGFGINPVTNTPNRLRMGYGGLMAEYTFSGNHLFHFTANTIIGAGGITNGYATKDRNHEEDWHSVESSAFFVAQPGINIETNVTKWFRIAAGGSYRLIGWNKLRGISNSDMSGVAANLSFKFGEF